MDTKYGYEDKQQSHLPVEQNIVGAAPIIAANLEHRKQGA